MPWAPKKRYQPLYNLQPGESVWLIVDDEADRNRIRNVAQQVKEKTGAYLVTRGEGPGVRVTRADDGEGIARYLPTAFRAVKEQYQPLYDLKPKSSVWIEAMGKRMRARVLRVVQGLRDSRGWDLKTMREGDGYHVIRDHRVRDMKPPRLYPGVEKLELTPGYDTMNVPLPEFERRNIEGQFQGYVRQTHEVAKQSLRAWAKTHNRRFRFNRLKDTRETVYVRRIQ